jgi:hypothetical protein
MMRMQGEGGMFPNRVRVAGIDGTPTVLSNPTAVSASAGSTGCLTTAITR